MFRRKVIWTFEDKFLECYWVRLHCYFIKKIKHSNKSIRINSPSENVKYYKLHKWFRDLILEFRIEDRDGKWTFLCTWSICCDFSLNPIFEICQWHSQSFYPRIVLSPENWLINYMSLRQQNKEIIKCKLQYNKSNSLLVQSRF